LHRQANFSSIFGYPPCRITGGKGVDIVAERIGGIVTSGVLSSLGLGDILITLGYSKTTIDVTDLIWKRARLAGFS
jgi:NADPH2:quinone reductase